MGLGELVFGKNSVKLFYVKGVTHLPRSRVLLLLLDVATRAVTFGMRRFSRFF